MEERGEDGLSDSVAVGGGDVVVYHPARGVILVGRRRRQKGHSAVPRR